MSKTERHKKLNPRAWANKWLKGSGMPIKSYPTTYQEKPGVTCIICKREKFADAYGNPDPTTFICDTCKDDNNKNK